MPITSLAGQAVSSTVAAGEKQAKKSILKSATDMIAPENSAAELLASGKAKDINLQIAGYKPHSNLRLSRRHYNKCIEIASEFMRLFYIEDGNGRRHPILPGLKFFENKLVKRNFLSRCFCNMLGIAPKWQVQLIAKPIEFADEEIVSENDHKMTMVASEIQLKDKELNNHANVIRNPVTLVSILIHRTNEIIQQSDNKNQSMLYIKLSAFIQNCVATLEEWYLQASTESALIYENAISNYRLMAEEFRKLSAANKNNDNLKELTQELIKPLSIIAGAIEDILSELLPGKTPLPIKFNQRAVKINKLLTDTSNLMHAIKPPEWQPEFNKISTANTTAITKITEMHNQVNACIYAVHEYINTFNACSANKTDTQIGDERLEKLNSILTNVNTQSFNIRRISDILNKDIKDYAPYNIQDMIKNLKHTSVFNSKDKKEIKYFKENAIPDFINTELTPFLLKTTLLYREISFAMITANSMHYLINNSDNSQILSELSMFIDYLRDLFIRLDSFAKDTISIAVADIMRLLDPAKYADNLFRWMIGTKIIDSTAYKQRKNKLIDEAEIILQSLEGRVKISHTDDLGNEVVTQTEVKGAMDIKAVITETIHKAGTVVEHKPISRAHRIVRLCMRLCYEHQLDILYISGPEKFKEMETKGPDELNKYINKEIQFHINERNRGETEIDVFKNLEVEARMLKIAEQNKNRPGRSDSQTIKECLATRNSDIHNQAIQQTNQHMNRLQRRDSQISKVEYEGLKELIANLNDAYNEYVNFIPEKFSMPSITGKHSKEKKEQAKQERDEVTASIDSFINKEHPDMFDISVMQKPLNKLVKKIMQMEQAASNHFSNPFTEQHCFAYYIKQYCLKEDKSILKKIYTDEKKNSNKIPKELNKKHADEDSIANHSGQQTENDGTNIADENIETERNKIFKHASNRIIHKKRVDDSEEEKKEEEEDIIQSTDKHGVNETPDQHNKTAKNKKNKNGVRFMIEKLNNKSDASNKNSTNKRLNSISSGTSEFFKGVKHNMATATILQKKQKRSKTTDRNRRRLKSSMV